MGDLRMGTIVDGVFDPGESEVLDSLLQAAVPMCQREETDVVFCSASLRDIGQGLRRHAFVRMPGTLNAAFRDRPVRSVRNPHSTPGTLCAAIPTLMRTAEI